MADDLRRLVRVGRFMAPMAIRAAREAVSMTHRPATLAAVMAPRRHQVRMVAAVLVFIVGSLPLP
ncbi:hypothetical protein ACIP4X_17925 [Streptomyces sp. NPDC088817]|uniref:hypothetical protein n=1 Tax=unclassified Streptomyces TaxID=2593676 RepID=UPI002DDAEB76|nr:hypothetical protein [Streptomyces sp. NBC_01788]WSB29707.1 hypothetical protein OIE49_29590 [Streptomyces sp. NBC_01788]